MNEFDEVNATMEKIFKVLNEAKLSGMTIYYMLGDIQNMVKEQIQKPMVNKDDSPNTESNS